MHANFQKIIPIKFFHQQNNYYCGAACVEMILYHLGCRLLNQRKLYEENHSIRSMDSGTGWSSPPDGVLSTLNKLKPHAFNGRFKLTAQSVSEAVSRKLVWAVYRFNTPGIALVYGWNHWVVVHGYQFKENPQDRDYKTHEINGIWIKNPMDDFYYVVDWIAWLGNYVDDAVPKGHWKNKYIAICDPPKKSPAKISRNIHILAGKATNPPAATPNIMATLPPLTGMVTPKIPLAKIAPLKKKLGNSMSFLPFNKLPPATITPQEAAAFAFRYLLDEGYTQMSFLKKSLANIKPGNPEITRSLHKKNDLYYIVPMISRARKIHALVSVSGTAAKFREAVFISHKNEPMNFKPLSPNRILESILKFLLDDPGKKFAVKQEILKFLRSALKIKKKKNQLLMRIDRILVWKPCLQTFSPFKPFYRVTIKRRTFYVMLDGSVHTRLIEGRGD